ncbi:endolytic transglycosylase MltG [Sphingoaurantiacus capsulatus]|uniref:Endolytic murein transglycosylase n=1 Tax=Sphingoaurantiacus capsulatus TaxID=1771310 RepID=A0ABV7XAB5_9SPHN
MKLRSLFIAAIALGVGALLFVLGGWYGPGPHHRDVRVQIDRGSSVYSAAAQLEKAGVIRSAKLFRVNARLLGGTTPIKFGEYEIPKRASAEAVLDILQGGEALQYRITVPEGMPSILVHERLMAIDTLTGEVPVPAEGSILPDTYAFERGEPRAKVVARMQAAMDKVLTDLWGTRKPTTVVKTPEEAITLAAVVEKETGKPSERRMVAGVYSNRLRIGMKLDADPTVIYPITKGKPLGRRIRRSELRADNGYNTYVRPGLPDGPIANPGRESIAAVLDPQPTEALYFVADGTGGHVFANSLAEHNRNVVKWRAIRRARGEL